MAGSEHSEHRVQAWPRSWPGCIVPAVACLFLLCRVFSAAQAAGSPLLNGPHFLKITAVPEVSTAWSGAGLLALLAARRSRP